MKAHALSLSFFLAVLPALSHPVAVPAAEAQQSQESWQLPWSGSSRPVHAYRGPVREEFLQCDQGQCPLPGAAVRDDAAEVTGQSVVKGQEVHAGHESPSREKTPPATAATTSPSAAGKGMTARAKDAPSAQTSSADTSEKRKPVTSAAASRPAAGTASGAARAEKPAAVNDAAPAPGTDSPSGMATADTSDPVTDEKAAYQAGLDLILSGRLDEGMARMQALLEQHPSGTYAANAEYWLGEALSSQGRNEEALTHFRNVEARYPKHHKNADALLRTGMILKQQGDTAGAGKVFLRPQRLISFAKKDWCGHDGSGSRSSLVCPLDRYG